jgi:hypothetical protein
LLRGREVENKKRKIIEAHLASTSEFNNMLHTNDVVDVRSKGKGIEERPLLCSENECV